MKRRIAQAPDDMTRAAGIIPIASSTGRILLNRRGAGMDHAGKYAGWGGYAAMGETPIENATREFHEESMYSGPLLLIPAYMQDYPHKTMTYETFIGIIPEEFEPQIDDESLGSEWMTMSQLYADQGVEFHPEFEKVLVDIKSTLSDLMLKIGVLHEGNSLHSLYSHPVVVLTDGTIIAVD